MGLVQVPTDYDGALEDIPDWCKKCGHEFFGIDLEDLGQFGCAGSENSLFKGF